MAAPPTPRPLRASIVRGWSPPITQRKAEDQEDQRRGRCQLDRDAKGFPSMPNINRPSKECRRNCFTHYGFLTRARHDLRMMTCNSDRSTH